MNSQNTVEKFAVKRKAKEPLSESSSCDSEASEIPEKDSIEPEIDCDEWDRTCKILNIPLTINKITGYHLMPTCLPEPKLEDKQVTLKRNLNEYLLKDFKNDWKLDEPINNNIVEIATTPWKVCVIKELLEHITILDDVRQEFYELNWNKRKMDLYEFYQSVDLKHLNMKNINLVYKFLKDDLMPLIGERMNFEFTHISATCSFYSDTDYLLVHDDKQEDRVVAFIWYLSDEWKDSWGGALQLFNCDENYQPNKVVRNIYPQKNQLILFPVSNISYHQVEEVTNKDFPRLSINGWFHGKVIPSTIIPVSPPLQGLYANKYINSNINDIDLNNFINETYLLAENIKDIQAHIEEFSEISLTDFFKDAFFESLSNALLDDQLQWTLVGPPNRLNYEILDNHETSECLDMLMKIFQSQVFFKLLESFTELELSKNDSGMKYEIQKWSPGYYSLLSDYEWNAKQELDVILYFGCERIVGGQIQYVSLEEEIQQALITLEHKNNTINLVYRDSARINSYVSKHTVQSFYVLICSYTENKI